MGNAHNKLPESIIIQRCEELNLNYLRSCAENSRTYVYFECEKHKHLGEQRIAWYHLRNATKGCKYCSGKNKTSDELQRELVEKCVPVTIIGEYVSARTKIAYRCNICGKEFNAIPNSLLNGQACPECGKIRRAKSRMKDTKQFKEDLSKVQPNIEVIGEYAGAHKLIRCRCKLDGYTWDSYPSNLLNKSAGCALCCSSISKGALAIKSYLDSHKIQYIQEHSFADCKRVSPLRFDFYLPEKCIAIEFDGRQHYERVPYFDHGESSLDATRERDAIKNKYCALHGIRMLRIPYYDEYRIIDILDSKLSNTDITT